MNSCAAKCDAPTRADTLRMFFSEAPAPAAWAKLIHDAGFPEPPFGASRPVLTEDALAA
ncbi:MAG: hypothetical protein ACYC91_09415 [Solirubrobacteraceae bacterium]